MKNSDIAYAVVRIGGKQYKVAPGDEIVVDRVAAEEGAHLVLEPLAVSDSGGELLTGSGLKAKVTATVADHHLGKKITVFTYNPKSTFKKKHGHRSRLSRLTIDAIEVAGTKEK